MDWDDFLSSAPPVNSTPLTSPPNNSTNQTTTATPSHDALEDFFGTPSSTIATAHNTSINTSKQDTSFEFDDFFATPSSTIASTNTSVLNTSMQMDDILSSFSTPINNNTSTTITTSTIPISFDDNLFFDSNTTTTSSSVNTILPPSTNLFDMNDFDNTIETLPNEQSSTTIQTETSAPLEILQDHTQPEVVSEEKNNSSPNFMSETQTTQTELDNISSQNMGDSQTSVDQTSLNTTSTNDEPTGSGFANSIAEETDNAHPVEIIKEEDFTSVQQHIDPVEITSTSPSDATISSTQLEEQTQPIEESQNNSENIGFEDSFADSTTTIQQNNVETSISFEENNPVAISAENIQKDPKESFGFNDSFSDLQIVCSKTQEEQLRLDSTENKISEDPKESFGFDDSFSQKDTENLTSQNETNEDKSLLLDHQKLDQELKQPTSTTNDVDSNTVVEAYQQEKTSNEFDDSFENISLSQNNFNTEDSKPTEASQSSILPEEQSHSLIEAPKSEPLAESPSSSEASPQITEQEPSEEDQLIQQELKTTTENEDTATNSAQSAIAIAKETFTLEPLGRKRSFGSSAPPSQRPSVPNSSRNRDQEIFVSVEMGNEGNDLSVTLTPREEKKLEEEPSQETNFVDTQQSTAVEETDEELEDEEEYEETYADKVNALREIQPNTPYYLGYPATEQVLTLVKISEKKFDAILANLDADNASHQMWILTLDGLIASIFDENLILQVKNSKITVANKNSVLNKKSEDPSSSPYWRIVFIETDIPTRHKYICMAKNRKLVLDKNPKNESLSIRMNKDSDDEAQKWVLFTEIPKPKNIVSDIHPAPVSEREGLEEVTPDEVQIPTSKESETEESKVVSEDNKQETAKPEASFAPENTFDDSFGDSQIQTINTEYSLTQPLQNPITAGFEESYADTSAEKVVEIRKSPRDSFSFDDSFSDMVIVPAKNYITSVEEQTTSTESNNNSVETFKNENATDMGFDDSFAEDSFFQSPSSTVQPQAIQTEEKQSQNEFIEKTEPSQQIPNDAEQNEEKFGFDDSFAEEVQFPKAQVVPAEQQDALAVMDNSFDDSFGEEVKPMTSTLVGFDDSDFGTATFEEPPSHSLDAFVLPDVTSSTVATENSKESTQDAFDDVTFDSQPFETQQITEQTPSTSATPITSDNFDDFTPVSVATPLANETSKIDEKEFEEFSQFESNTVLEPINTAVSSSNKTTTEEEFEAFASPQIAPHLDDFYSFESEEFSQKYGSIANESDLQELLTQVDSNIFYSLMIGSQQSTEQQDATLISKLFETIFPSQFTTQDKNNSSEGAAMDKLEHMFKLCSNEKVTQFSNAASFQYSVAEQQLLRFVGLERKSKLKSKYMKRIHGRTASGRYYEIDSNNSNTSDDMNGAKIPQTPTKQIKLDISLVTKEQNYEELLNNIVPAALMTPKSPSYAYSATTSMPFANIYDAVNQSSVEMTPSKKPSFVLPIFSPGSNAEGGEEVEMEEFSKESKEEQNLFDNDTIEAEDDDDDPANWVKPSVRRTMFDTTQEDTTTNAVEFDAQFDDNAFGEPPAISVTTHTLEQLQQPIEFDASFDEDPFAEKESVTLPVAMEQKEQQIDEGFDANFDDSFSNEQPQQQPVTSNTTVPIEFDASFDDDNSFNAPEHKVSVEKKEESVQWDTSFDDNSFTKQESSEQIQQVQSPKESVKQEQPSIEWDTSFDNDAFAKQETNSEPLQQPESSTIPSSHVEFDANFDDSFDSFSANTITTTTIPQETSASSVPQAQHFDDSFTDFTEASTKSTSEEAPKSTNANSLLDDFF